MNKTLKEIAKISGVSLGTVSRILNGKPGFNPHTVTKVKNIAGKLDYFPYCKSRTKGMLRNPQKYIGIITPPNDNGISAVLETAIEKVFTHYGFYLIRFILTTENDIIPNMDLFRSNVMENSDIAGLISITVSFSDKTISELQDRNIPIVFVDKYVDYGKCVYVDNEKAIFNAVTKLISLNHKKIGFISPGPIGSGYDIWAERLNGYKRALNEHGIGYNPRLIENEGSFDLELIKIATKRLLEKNRDLSAIVFISDKTAIAGMKAVIESGRKIPDDISIIGFDDIEFDAYLTPSLSSIKQPAYEMGERASKMLYSAITKKDYKHESVRLNAELILRDSVKRIKKT